MSTSEHVMHCLVLKVRSWIDEPGRHTYIKQPYGGCISTQFGADSGICIAVVNAALFECLVL